MMRTRSIGAPIALSTATPAVANHDGNKVVIVHLSSMQTVGQS
jgi:hypothetical protein